MKEYDEQIGPLLSRREAMVVLGTTSVIWLMTGTRSQAQAASDTPQSLCLIRPEQTEGPYFLDERLHRMDIRSDPSNGKITPGTELALTFHISRVHAGECHPLPNAQVDVWHCDALGVYSDVRDPGFSTVGQKFLRGFQLTDAHGTARFLTIYPGWYPVRTVHIHFKIRTALMARKHYEFTSQLYFPDELTDRVYTAPPYTGRGPRIARNRQDWIFRQGGDRLMLAPSPTDNGYAATFALGLQLP
jgi:protocatechuate 3,4-dioxygenase beta subunit